MDRKRHHDGHAETNSSYPTKRQRTFPNNLNNTPHETQNTSPSHDDYTIAWICALYIEMAAARAVLDEIYKDLPRSTNNSNTYTLSSIKKHNIVIACLPTAQYGTNNAANNSRAETQAKATYMPYPRIEVESISRRGIGSHWYGHTGDHSTLHQDDIHPPAIANMRRIDRDLANDHRQRLLESLEFSQIDARKSTIKSPHFKTCRWFLNHPEYQA
ncbi:hypothetical protein AUP68_06325 [Ilyonectria robusta]